MQIYNIHESIIVMKSIATRFFRNVVEAVQKTRSTCFIRSKTTRLRLVVLNAIKHSCSFFRHYINATLHPFESSSYKINKNFRVSYAKGQFVILKRFRCHDNVT